MDDETRQKRLNDALNTIAEFAEGLLALVGNGGSEGEMSEEAMKELEAFLDIPFRFWTCHQHETPAIVKWIGKVAVCEVCGNTSQVDRVHALLKKWRQEQDSITNNLLRRLAAQSFADELQQAIQGEEKR